MYFDRFISFSSAIEEVYKSLQKIKAVRMGLFGLHSTDAMCLVMLTKHPEGMTATALAKACKVDKAVISRSVRSLLSEDAVCYTESGGQKNYRAPLVLTEKGGRIALQMISLAGDAVEHTSGQISPEELAQFYHILGIIGANLKVYARDLETEQKKKKEP